jgi:signal transduction histidine kinase
MQLSLATRIFVGYAVVLVTFGAVSVFSVTELHRNQVEIRLVSEGYLALAQTAAAVDTFQKNQSRDMERLADPDTSEQTRRSLIQLSRKYFFDLMAEKLDGGAATSRELLSFAPEAEKPFVAAMEKKFIELRGRYTTYQQTAEEAFAVLELPEPNHAAAAERLNRLAQLETGISSSIRLLHESLQARIRDRVRQAQERERRTGVAIIALSVLAIVVGLIATGIAARGLKPVRTLIEGVSRIGRGDYSAKLGIEGGDEIALLAREFDAMARSLREREALLQQQQAALLQAEKLAAVGRISAQVAHEVRNPLSSIGLNVEMLQEQFAAATFATPEEAREAQTMLASVTREVDRLTEITEEYLQLARQPAPAMRRENLVGVLESLLGFSRESLSRAGVKVVTAFEAPELEVSADEGQLRQVFLNIFRNAQEAMAGGGELLVATRTVGDRAQVRISDSGPGMTDAVRARLFEPFFTTKQGGTGLGLSVSRQIIQAHGGSIEVEQSPARGTTFIVTLPRT